MIWTSHSDRRELGPLPISPQRTYPGWTTRTSIRKPEEWSTKIKRMRAENGTNSTLNMEKKNVCLKMCNELDKQSSDGECFLAEIVSQCHRSLGILLYALSAELVLKNKSNFRKRFYGNWRNKYFLTPSHLEVSRNRWRSDHQLQEGIWWTGAGWRNLWLCFTHDELQKKVLLV